MTVLSDLGASNSVIKTMETGFVYVNSFYDGVNFTGPIGSSQPLSGKYATLAAAQADYPQATALSDEVDWCAWQAASLFVNTRDGSTTPSTSGGINTACGSFIADGRYVVNKTITFIMEAAEVVGTTAAERFGGTHITYNGSGGTVDDPIGIFDFYLADEFGYGPYGALPTTGITVSVRNIVFSGKGGDMHSANQNVSAYVSGIRIRASSGCDIQHCTFTDTLYDGISVTAPSLFLRIEKNLFYGCHRDGIYIHGTAHDFTTTTWIRNNEFGFLGRYGIFLDFFGAVTPNPMIEANSFEFDFSDSYYWLHPEWFVDAVPSAVCCIGCDGLQFRNNYWEMSVYKTGLNLHECGTVFIGPDKGPGRLYVTSSDNSQARSNAAIAYDDPFTLVTGVTQANPGVVHDVGHGYSNGTTVHLYNIGGMTQLNGRPFTVTVVDADHFSIGVDTTGYSAYTSGGRATTGRRYLDVTDARNYRTGYTGHFGQALILHAIACNITSVVGVDVPTLDGTIASTFRDIDNTLFFWAIPSTAASARDGFEATSEASAVPIYQTLPSVAVLGSTGHSSGRSFGNFNSRTQSGDYSCNGVLWTAWQASHSYTSGINDSMTALFVVPTSGHWTGYFYQCIVAGTSGGSEPAWRTDSTPFTDGGVTWQLADIAFLASENLRREDMQFGMRRFQAEQAAPTVGRFTLGDQAIYRIPDAGGGTNPYVGQICVSSGVPGTWKTFGAISS